MLKCRETRGFWVFQIKIWKKGYVFRKFPPHPFSTRKYQIPSNWTCVSKPLGTPKQRPSEMIICKLVYKMSPRKTDVTWKSATLRILRHCNGGVWVLKIATFEGSGYLGQLKRTIIFSTPPWLRGSNAARFQGSIATFQYTPRFMLGSLQLAIPYQF